MYECNIHIITFLWHCCLRVLDYLVVQFITFQFLHKVLPINIFCWRSFVTMSSCQSHIFSKQIGNIFFHNILAQKTKPLKIEIVEILSLSFAFVIVTAKHVFLIWVLKSAAWAKYPIQIDFSSFILNGLIEKKWDWTVHHNNIEAALHSELPWIYLFLHFCVPHLNIIVWTIKMIKNVSIWLVEKQQYRSELMQVLIRRDASQFDLNKNNID